MEILLVAVATDRHKTYMCMHPMIGILYPSGDLAVVLHSGVPDLLLKQLAGRDVCYVSTQMSLQY